MIIIDLSELYAATGTAKLSELLAYEKTVLEIAGNGQDITLTGNAPIWLYLRLSHALHGRARKLIYDSPVTNEVVIFDHNPH